MTDTAVSSPSAFPAAPESAGVGSLVGELSAFSVTTGAVVSTLKVTGALVVLLPAASLWVACAV